jgi:hypothetical protein
MSTPSTHAEDRRSRRKEKRRQEAQQGPMGRRRAYRAAQEVLEQGFDLWKIADNKARLALMLLGPLNVVLLLLLANPAVFLDLSPRERAWILTGIVAYAVLAMAMFLLAIGTLRPEVSEPVVPATAHGRRDDALGIRHYEDVLGWSVDDYQRAWRLVTREQLVAEVAQQAHAVAEANRRKFRALHRLFRGLKWMTGLAVLLLLAIGAGLAIEHHGDTSHLPHFRIPIPGGRP